ncbi:hypothetical protein EP47_01540 [Legionella norrlandica]|uniref:Small-conductance mechanosensitive channel n=1 Tax=Legionella norrlandica TaxID=1498499 RepID=A0A0A2SNA2_9GAMM|nr:mechanosensitive ion channel domain-containing protein [Legionella norrlandica]KGP62222.1 hypothetical protein EP47_01540 [Legionella norrlandica]
MTKGKCLHTWLTRWLFIFTLSVPALYCPLGLGQESPKSIPKANGDYKIIQSQTLPDPVDKIVVKPEANDDEIGKRIEGILVTTPWFIAPSVQVKNGVVFLKGKTKHTEHKKWAENLASHTQDVVAVVNQIEVINPAIWSFQQITKGLLEQWQRMLRGLPFFIFALIVLFISWLIARFASRSTRNSLQYRKVHPLLTDVISRGVTLLCLLFGAYIILQVLGLTTFALTVLGGTGIIGIILGISLRDITENLLASILLSMQKPFHKNDLVEISELDGKGITGYVQGLTIRATVLMTQEGHQIQIPNSTVYKSNIRNFSSNPNRREDFIIGITYEDAISKAQEVALKLLERHPAVLKDPEPWVLVENLTADAVNMRVYFWMDGSKYHWRKVRSSVIRLVKRALQDAGIEISWPGKGIEISFLEDIPVRLLQRKPKAKKEEITHESGKFATHAEGELSSEAAEIEEQNRLSRPIEKEKNLLR